MGASTSSSMKSDFGKQAKELYSRLRAKVETPENIGKFIVFEVESGDYEIDDQGIESSRRLQIRHPGKALYSLRIGYKTAVSFSGGLERTTA